VKAAQTGILIEKTPKSAAELLKKFETDRKEILGMLNDVQKTRPMFKPYYELLINN
jgi:hypothetical protein